MGLPKTHGDTRILRILDFDIENRPLTYIGQDFTTKDITVLAAGWVGDPESVDVRWVDLSNDNTQGAMLEWFIGLFREADIVTGHYILKHDLPAVQGALLEHGLEPLGPKVVQDTFVHLKRVQGIPKSQEALSDMLGLPSPKVGMSQFKWRSANRLEPEGISYACERALGDVRQHMELRAKLIEEGRLAAPTLWSP